MVVLATVATVIASQAVISGAFSVTRQAVQLGFLPRLTIRHTSEHEVGQIYVPARQLAAVRRRRRARARLRLVDARSPPPTASRSPARWRSTRSCSSSSSASLWHKPLWLVVVGAAAFLVVDLAFFAANLPKVVHGGWFPLADRRSSCSPC